ncbi:hydroxyacyl-thioester dehydratase type 2, mitochondrial-like [Asterias rubens]|uniref:hydroxyacyl-thioester dehydratase type 2, mitochondrial-like n=1 Tax=Asterias rubens TaxID=7604 RepID=UPI001454F8F3|nr:hydroxyacyl-thioester dehydratase type 2, mitochondrial-like [Asterias rubens]XP_033625380.1 hydroxyacyl-thioester dehydratase type 2, mitochondrial-like [Asterias rubens]XP_033625388.1 hydroxyacyl-thioester dehydratase type 2, mitochondrial-like [Asterias rubens]
MLLAKTVTTFARLVSRPLSSRSFSGIWFQEGDTASITKTFSSQDVQKFAELSEDTNPIHVNDEYAETARFGKCIVHGILVNGLISAVLGTKLPGPGTIVLSQMCEFPAPLYIGEPVTASVTVVNIDRRLVTCSASCIANERNENVLTGSVRLLVPRRKPSIPPRQ